MMTVDWTDEQQRAISAKGKGIVVPAAAGSGKTAVLIERVVNILADEKTGITPDSLLAVTFTTDATANMKRKLSQEFEKRIECCPDDEWLRKQQSLLAGAKIRTINAFCLDFVKENFSRLPIRDDVSIIDSNEQSALFDMSIDEALEEFYESSPELMKKLTDHLCGERDTDLSDHIKELNRVLDSIPFREYWLRDVIEDLKSGKAYQNAVDTLFSYADNEKDKLVKNIEFCRRVINEFSFAPKIKKLAEDNLLILDDLVTKINKRDMQGIYRLATDEKPSFGRLTSALEKQLEPYSDNQLLTSLFARFKDERERYMSTAKALIKELSYECDKQMEMVSFSGELFEGIAELTMRAREIFEDKKLDKNAVSFADVEDMTVRLLLEYDGKHYKRTDLCEDIVKNGQYKIIMIDEFQDVNDLQELIFKALSDTNDLEVMGKNVFIVGDVKQAIYGFRQTNPELLLKTLYQAGLEENSEKLEIIRLSKNFRSRDNVIDFVNDTFKTLMSPTVGDVDYNDSEMLSLGAKYPQAEHKTDVLYFTCSDTADDEDETDDAKKTYDEYGEEHIAVANYISDMIKKGVPVTDNGTLRPCRASDFCVLVRKNAPQVRFAKALEAVGISSFYDIVGGYMNAREILVMMNLLRIIDSPRNDIAMLSVMLSPIFGFDANEVTEVRLLCKEDESGTVRKLYQVMLAISKDKNEQHEKETERISVDNKQLEKKCRNAVALIKKLRYFAASMPLEALVNKIYDETDLYSVAAAYENSRQMRANLRMLIEIAAAYDKTGGSGGLAGFIRYFERIAASGKDFDQAMVSTSDSDGVIIQTMHSSKGLEYPFVILADTGYEFSRTDIKKRFLCDRKFGVAVKYHNVYDLSLSSNINYNAVRKQIWNKQLSEEMRLLYVALTRAKERLCIVFPINESGRTDLYKRFSELSKDIETLGGVTDSIVKDCKSYLQWLYLTLCGYKEFSPVTELISVKTGQNMKQLCHEHRSSIDLIKGDTKERGKGPFEYKTAAPDDKLVDTLANGFLYEDGSKLSKVISKLSVTEIVRNEQEKKYKDKNPEFYPQLPRLDEEIGKLTHAERGTYTHLFMELADYERAEISVKDELARLVSGRHFTEKEAEGVYIGALEMFFASSFYKRMKASKNIMREKRFLTSIDELSLGAEFDEFKNTDAMVQGIADSIFEEDDGYVIVDYKTDRFGSEEDMDKYKTQLLIYKAAFDLILDKKVKSCYIYSFWLGMGREMIF
ncbi:MAG: UvrD-helicase domain-containing protein [Ruminococcus sp.]|nr:UvrD-helicase domain-containing protein [Ruminococcus sp.]